jgi:hypothetical protein
LEPGNQLRWFVCLLALGTAWPLTPFDYNYYFGQAYVLDRILLGALVVLLWLRPLFIYPFLLLAFAILSQLALVELSGSILAHKLQVLHVLNLFGATFLIHAITRSPRTQNFGFLTCCLVASAYCVAAMAKLDVDWFAQGHLLLILPAAYAHGWLGQLDPNSIVELTNLIAPFDLLIRVMVVAVEGACLIFLWNRRWSMILLAGVMLFHVAVFALYGFLFWTWVLVDSALLVVLFRYRATRELGFYTRTYALASIVLITVASSWAMPPQLGWLDMWVTYSFQIEAIDTDGNQYTLAPRYFAPYEDYFTMASFGYLVHDRRMPSGPYGVSKSPAQAQLLFGIRNAQDLFDLESDQGAVRYKQDKVEQFRSFVERFAAAKNNLASSNMSRRWWRALRQFWSHP